MVQPLDAVDRALIGALVTDGRLANSALARSRGGGRLHGPDPGAVLVQRGVIRGFTADMDPVKVGRPVQAIVALRLRTHDAKHVMGSPVGSRNCPR